MVLRRDPEQAANAYYWATRLDPMSADSYYNRRIALLLTNPRRLAQYWRGQKNVVQASDMQRIDSLYWRALMLNPAIPQRFHRELTLAVIRSNIESDGGSISPGELDMAFDRYIHTAVRADELRASMAQSDGDNLRALGLYASAAKQDPKDAGIRIARGRLFLQIGKADSAVVELTKALELLQTRDKKDFVVYYNSKAMLETTIGIAHQQLSDMTAAKDAFGRALQEDLAYYPAHVRLGYLALDQKDTTTALSELELAVQLRADDALLRDQYGYALLLAGKPDAAIGQLKKATELEPFYALPQRHLGEAYEKTGNTKAALEAYRAFLVLSGKFDTNRGAVEKRLAALGGATQ
jgi:tetratricopeptide (TPR) repeat protein